MAFFNNLTDNPNYKTNYFKYFYEYYTCVNDTFETFKYSVLT